MSDKVQLIKEEILRRKQSWQHSDKQYEHGGKDVCDYLLGFIDSLPEEFGCEVNFTTKSEDLEEYYTKEFLPKEWFANPGHRTISQFNFFTAHHFAEWQKKKDQEIIELAEDHAMLAGMNKMKEEMMENAVYGYVALCHDYPYRRSLVAIADGLINFEYAEKVKIIIVKEE